MPYFAHLTTATSSYEALSAFMGGDGLAQTLSAISDVHVRAARLAVADIDRAVTPEALVEEIRSHLRVAYSANTGLLKPDSLGMKIFNWTPFSFRARLSAAVRAWRISSLLAMCNLYLGEPELLEDHLRQANEDFLRVASLGSGDYRWGRLSGDLLWKYGEYKPIGPSEYEIESYEELVQNLRKLPIPENALRRRVDSV